MKPLRLIVVIALFAFEGCGDHGGPPTKQEIAGVYKGRYAGGIETIDIRINGSFSQDFRVGSSLVYTSNGTWDIQGKNLSFTPFAFPTEILRMKGDGRSQVPRLAFGLAVRFTLSSGLGHIMLRKLMVKVPGWMNRPLKWKTANHSWRYTCRAGVPSQQLTKDEANRQRPFDRQRK
jgi:hypothetical protein